MAQDLEFAVGISASSIQFVHASSIVRILIFLFAFPTNGIILNSYCPWSHTVNVDLFKWVPVVKGRNYRQKATVEFSGDFVMLALVTRFYMGFNLWAKVLPCEGLVDAVDCLNDSWVVKVGVVPVDDVSLEA